MSNHHLYRDEGGNQKSVFEKNLHSLKLDISKTIFQTSPVVKFPSHAHASPLAPVFVANCQKKPYHLRSSSNERKISSTIQSIRRRWWQLCQLKSLSIDAKVLKFLQQTHELSTTVPQFIQLTILYPIKPLINWVSQAANFLSNLLFFI